MNGQNSGSQGVNGNTQFEGSQAGGKFVGQGGQSGNSFFYNKTYNSYSEGLSAEEQEQIRKNLAAAAQGAVNQGSSGSFQGSHSHGSGWSSQAGSAQGGFGQGQVVRVKNKTIIYDENHNIISETESSTEYGNLGHEGEPGSSFSV